MDLIELTILAVAEQPMTKPELAKLTQELLGSNDDVRVVYPRIDRLAAVKSLYKDSNGRYVTTLQGSQNAYSALPALKRIAARIQYAARYREHYGKYRNPPLAFDTPF